MNQLATDGKCQRCGRETTVTTMSTFNTEMCCMFCIDNEQGHKLYEYARKQEFLAVKRGDYNFPGIGLPQDI